MWVFLLAVALVFLVLAAQYESWALPLAVILVVPMCLLCSIAGVVFAKMDVNIFTQIGFLVLVGLACKNAILIVEFAKAQRESGMSRAEATLAACQLRLRPIIMTSFAFVLGVVPLMVSVGAGAEMRQTLGTAVFSGMLGVTLFGIFLTPVFYYVIQWFADRRSEALARQQVESNGHPDVAEEWYGTACFLSRNVSLARTDPRLPDSKRRELADDYTQRALDALRQAVDSGYQDVEHMKRDKDLAPLREHELFQLLTTEMEKGNGVEHVRHA
jgi:predicted RND superfamily exporter protein